MSLRSPTDRSPSTDETQPFLLRQQVRLQFEYPVIFTRAMFESASAVLRDILAPDRGPGSAAPPARVFVAIDEGVLAATPALRSDIARYFAAQGARLSLVADPIGVPGGEQSKNDPAVVRTIHERLFALGLDRHAYLLAIGGGAVLDAVGYAAALFHRGMRLVRVPTTVLAQNDAGVGVKNGINAFGVKNALGTFAPPYAVINDGDFLRTLPARDRIAGMAEAVKVALVRDEAFFHWLREHAVALRAGEEASTSFLIRRCAELHLEHIREGGDPFESGSARPLDFGHWAAHKLELLTGHALRHGEAVAIGMAVDIRYSQLSGLLKPEAASAASSLLEALGLPRHDQALSLRDPSGERAVLRGLEEFREHLGGQLSVTMLAALGRGQELHEIDRALMERAIDDVQAAS